MTLPHEPWREVGEQNKRRKKREIETQQRGIQSGSCGSSLLRRFIHICPSRPGEGAVKDDFGAKSNESSKQIILLVSRAVEHRKVHTGLLMDILSSGSCLLKRRHRL